MNFNDLYWHDSTIQSISIKRDNPGYNDSIIFEIDWYDTGLGKIIFYDVLKAKFDLNFGMIVRESILNAECVEVDESLALLREQQNDFFLTYGLNCYLINTNSTASQIKIYAAGFQLEV